MRPITRLILAGGLGLAVAIGGLGLGDTLGAPASVAHARAAKVIKLTPPKKTGQDMNLYTCNWHHEAWLCDGNDGKKYVCNSNFTQCDRIRA